MADAILDRRRLLIGAGALAVTGLAGACATPRVTTVGGVQPFTLGVASGDPAPDGFVLWTRLAPDPLASDGSGGMTAAQPVRWEVAADAAMRQVVRSGTARADPAFAHSVHVEVAGLRPDCPYWYRFTAMGAQSAVGRARTAPAPGRPLDRLRFAFASCSHWELGYFSAYRHMAAENPDLVIFLGDYIYEYSNTGKRAEKVIRPHDQQGEVVDLAGYRNRYALHRTDPDLQALHAVAPCLMTWDDHEVQNDYANRWSQDPKIGVEDFLRRRRAAYQAYYEHMPLRRRSIPGPDETRIYDRARFGDLAEFAVLDGRQYRTMQPCPLPDWRGGHVAPLSCTDRDDPAHTMLGATQERWLIDGFKTSKARWNIIAQDLLVASLVQQGKDGAVGHWTDGWDGYPACRQRVLDGVTAAKLANPVFLGGDIHSFWTTDLKADFGNPDSATIATEFVGSSITSDGPPYDLYAKILPQNPHVKFFDSRQRGYVSADLTHDRMETRFQVISDRADPKATVSTLKSFVVEAGKAGAVAA